MALERGNLDRAAQAFRQAVELLRPYEAKERMLMARSNADFARVLFRQKRYDEAEPLARWALAVRESIPGTRSEALIQNLVLLAQIHRAQRRYSEAQSQLERAVAVQVKAVGAGHSDIAPTLEELAELYAEQGHLAEAATHYHHALAIRDANHEKNVKNAEEMERRLTLLRDVQSVTGTRGAMGANQAAQVERFESQAKAVRESTAESVTAAAATQRYAAVLRRAGRNDEAESMEVRAKAMRDAAETHAARAAAGRQ
jgi:tetratricopeptide (TPR) repeat protein